MSLVVLVIGIVVVLVIALVAVLFLSDRR